MVSREARYGVSIFCWFRNFQSHLDFSSFNWTIHVFHRENIKFQVKKKKSIEPKIKPKPNG